MSLTRRQFLGAAAAVPALRLAGTSELPPVRAITSGPKFHWFGYYDKLEFDPTGRFVLGMEVGFEHRSPRADDEIRIGMVDLERDDEWLDLGSSTAWCWQQGCMLQWRPGSDREILWNDRDDDRFVCRILDVRTEQLRTVPYPIYSVGPDGRTAVGADFRRIQDMRKGYGYAGLADPHRDELAPDDTGIYRVDLDRGEREVIVTLRDVAAAARAPRGAKHYFNHLLVGPDGERFIFLHRFRPKGGGGFRTRMLTAGLDGSDVRVVDDSGHTSHFIWRDPEHILAWSRIDGRNGFYLFDERTGESEIVAPKAMPQNGHCSYLPGGEWILNDTYPDRDRLQHPYLYHASSGRRVPLGHFGAPAEYGGEWRCDTHPRFSPDGRSVVIDSPHDGGRQLYLIDIGEIVL